RTCRLQIAAKWLFYDHPRVLRAASEPQLLDDAGESARRNGQIVCRPLGTARAQDAVQLFEGRRVIVVAVDVVEALSEHLERSGVEPAVLAHARLGACDQLLPSPPGTTHTNHGKVELSAASHGLQRGEDLLVGEVSGGAEEHQCI